MTTTDDLNHRIREILDHKIGLILLSQARLNRREEPPTDEEEEPS
jgi:hypothetical protein